LISIVGSGCVLGVFAEDWTFIESLYWTVITVTTVGYGDYAPSPGINRLVVSFYILLAGGSFAAILAGVISSYIAIRRRAASLLFLMGSLTPERLQRIPKNARGEVSRMEFLVYMITKLGYCPAEDLELINDCFSAMDIDGDGSLSVTNMLGSTEGRELLDQMRLRHGIRDGDRNMLPLGFLGIRFKFVKEKMEDKTYEQNKKTLARKSAQAAVQTGSPQPKADKPESAADSVNAVLDGFIPRLQDYKTDI